MVSVKNAITEVIRKNGFISVDEFMLLSLSGREDSYYVSKNPLQKDIGDFITSPEVSQMFGEMIAMWCVDAWYKLGRPASCNLVEFGPGTGRLMHDVLRASKVEKEFYAAINIWLIDISTTLKAAQKNLLKQFDKEIEWVSSIDEVSKNPTIVLANEFFDALPIRQYEKFSGVWKERVLVLNDEGEFDFSHREVERGLFSRYKADNGIFEESPESVRVMSQISKHIKDHGGAALIIDYGYDIDPALRGSNQYNSTLQAVKNHKYASVLDEPGEADLTAHVDFWRLRQVASSNDLDAPYSITQREFLSGCGIDIRLAALMKSNPDLAGVLRNQYSRLMDEDKMGKLFRVIAVIARSVVTRQTMQ